MGESLVIRIDGNVKGFQDALKGVKDQTKNLEKQLANVAKISGAAFAALSAVIGGTVTAFASFEKSGTEVKTLLDDTSFATKSLNDGFKDLQSGILDIGKNTGQSFDSLNNALFGLISSGVSAGDSLEALSAAADLANVGSTSVDAAVKALTATMTSFGNEAGSASDIAEKFFTAQKFGNTTVEQLANNFNKVAGIAKELNQGFDETLAAATALTNNGVVPTEQAFTQLNAVYTSVLSAGEKLKSATPEVAEAFSLANIKSVGLVEALNQTKEALGGDVQAFQKLLGSAEALKAALALTGSQTDSYNLILKKMQNEAERTANFQARLKDVMDDTGKRFDVLKNQALAAAIVIGEKFAPFVNSLIDSLSGLFQLIADNPVLSNMAVVLIAVSAAVSGVIFSLTGLGIIILKIRSTYLALNIAFGITSKLMVIQSALAKAYSATVSIMTARISLWSLVTKAASLASTGLVTVLKLVRIAVTLALGPIGIIITVLSTLAFIFREEIGNTAVKAWEALTEAFATGARIIQAQLVALGGVLVRFKEGFLKTFDGLGDILLGLFTLDTDKIKAGFEKATSAVGDTFTDLGTEAANNFNDAFQQQLSEDEEARAQSFVVPIARNPNRVPTAADGAGPVPGGGDEALATQEKQSAAQIQIERNRLEVLRLENENASAELISLKKEESDLLLEIEKEKTDVGKELLTERLTENRQLQIEERDAELERRQIFQEEIIEQNIEFNELTKEQQEEFFQENRELIATQREEEKQARDEALKEELEARKKQRIQFLKDEKKFGKTFATLRETLNSEEIQGAKQASGELIQLQRSSNSTLQGIGKAAALTQIALKTAASAMNIFEGFTRSVPPPAGPILGVAGAAAAIAFGAEQAGKVTSAQDGGLITGGIPGIDSVPALLAPGELVTPAQNFEEVIGAVAAQRNQASLGDDAEDVADSGQVQEVVITVASDMIEVIEQRIVERRDLGVGIL